MALWEDRWVAITSELSEWDTLDNVSAHIASNISLAGTAAATFAASSNGNAGSGNISSYSNGMMGSATGAGYSAVELALDLAIAKFDWAAVGEVCAKLVCVYSYAFCCTSGGGVIRPKCLNSRFPYVASSQPDPILRYIPCCTNSP